MINYKWFMVVNNGPIVQLVVNKGGSKTVMTTNGDIMIGDWLMMMFTWWLRSQLMVHNGYESAQLMVGNDGTQRFNESGGPYQSRMVDALWPINSGL